MADVELTDCELLVLGLISEMPRHGYELEQVIKQRGMREWTPIGFSSIYYLLNKLEKKRLAKAATPAGAKAKKTYTITKPGRRVLESRTLEALETVCSAHPSLLMGMLHWSLLSRGQALNALQARKMALAKELQRLETIHFEQQPVPDYVDAMFGFSIGQLEAEARWVAKTLDYMQTKPWNT